MPTPALTEDRLFDLTPANPLRTNLPAIPNKVTRHRKAPRRNPDHRAAPCNPVCVVCGRPEPDPQPDQCHTCPATPGRRCATLCDHTNQPYRADICITTVRTTAAIHTSPHSGHTIAVVAACPHCGGQHPHAPNPGTHYLISACAKPYIVHIAKPGEAD